MKNISYIWCSLKDWCSDLFKEPIMIVEYDTTDNSVSCINWIGKKIYPFCGELSPDRWDKIKKYCGQKTKIYIWAGMEKKHLAYCEPINNYLSDEKLLQTGQGYHWRSGKRYGEVKNPKCPCCGK